MEEGKLTLNLQELDVGEVMHPVAQEFKHAATAEDKRIEVDIEDGVPRVSIDRDLIYRTLSNLMINAIKHTPRNGVITVAAVSVDGGLELEVRDTGQGIPDEFRETIFEKFGQVESRQRSGTGLGLTFCKMAVEAHGGTIRVVSEEGEGSRFISFLTVQAT